MDKKTTNNPYIEVTEKRAIVYLPEDTIEAEINITLYKNGEIQNVSKTLNTQEVYKAFGDAEDNYIEDTDVFRLSEKGMEYLKQLENNVD